MTQKNSKKGIAIHSKGIVKLNVSSPDKRIPMFLRELERTGEKNKMALKAITHIKDGYTVMLDASASAFSIIPHLESFKNIFVITGGTKSASALTALGIKCPRTGGQTVMESFSRIGPDAEVTLK